MIVTAANGCKVWDKIFVNSIFGNISENNESLGVNIWPNPTSNLISLSMKASTVSGVLNVAIVNTLGQMVQTDSIEVTKGIAKRYSFSVRELAIGTYYLHIIQGDKVITKHKIVVTR